MREKVLKKIRTAQQKSFMKYDPKEPDLKKFVFKKPDESLPEKFAKEFNKNKGKFIYCQNNTDMVRQLRKLIQANNWKNVYCTEENIRYILNDTSLKYKFELDKYTNADLSITCCMGLVARTGSILIVSGTDSSRKLSIYPPVHIVVAYYDQMFFDLENAFKFFKQKYEDSPPSMLSIISGPSRTADIEKTLVLGAHGPKDLYCFYVNDR
ncbi:MAG: lactate utilization protein [Bacteroidetes bacterium]|nr:lactate utilization protein [Bacteroidota bacterium]MBL6962495.1 lactate utilization protein [Bacteroidota bacterium]